jgi:hypothetical protein
MYIRVVSRGTQQNHPGYFSKKRGTFQGPTATGCGWNRLSSPETVTVTNIFYMILRVV